MSWAGKPRQVSYDADSLVVDGKPFFCLSGAVHYVRSHPSLWPQIFRSMRRDGLNTIETYVFWGEHEREPLSGDDQEPHADFSGPRDLVRFLRCAALHGLNAILRLGPYVCAEVNYGGFPWWLRQVCERSSDKPVRFRTWDPAYCTQVERWLKYLVNRVLKPARVFAPQGGPVILAQIENEYAMVAETYGSAGQRYLDWIASLADQLALQVPLVMCYGSSQKAFGRVIETINAFYAHKQVEPLQRAHAETPQPLFWTECWTGWYDVWGAPHHKRDARDLAYAVLRFLAVGGAGVNYYMYFGGTNTRRESSMYLQATSYDYDAPLNEYLMETTKSRHLRRLHHCIRPYISETRGILNMSQLELEVCEKECRAILYERLASPGSDGDRSLTGRRCIFDSADIQEQLSVHLHELLSGVRNASMDQCLLWSVRLEAPPLADARYPAPVLPSALPDLIEATACRSDYAWYILQCPEANGDGILRLELADFGRVWRNVIVSAASNQGQPTIEWVTSGPEPPIEDRFPNAWNQEDYGYGRIVINRVGPNEEYVVLVSSLGMVKGDWQLPPGQSMSQERKGLIRAVYCADASTRTWQDALVVGFAAGLGGERSPGVIEGDADAFPLLWTPPQLAVQGMQPSWPRWYRTSLALPPTSADENEGILLDLFEAGLQKGWIYVNGHPCGRHWRVAGTRPKNGFLLQPGQEAPIEQVDQGQPTQRYYYVPSWQLRNDGRPNNLVIFDEHANSDNQEFDPRRLRIYRPMLRVAKCAETPVTGTKP
ncbi:hypothetical protein F1559_001235 [Cyanidiococcus yangmingshanensis]|uniref:Beta-galactosidase n=1 Tax=Cyanidiococcus yangmingshanensis TaxID=2690220 RepID=A0A7J7IL56_9RHOD|nr:hypothetical protein F1559_001235 [Cyanidiococcus yangmingshanensis]